MVASSLSLVSKKSEKPKLPAGRNGAVKTTSHLCDARRFRTKERGRLTAAGGKKRAHRYRIVVAVA
jgi:hypothetical protein